MSSPLSFTSFLKQAHDSGDGETIYHCPFCGSGQVLARSDRTIECQFCHTCFTVQVQPEFPAFPQTIDGMPVQVPGMPGQVDPMAGMGGPVDPNADMAAAGGFPPEDENPEGIPDAADGDDEDEDDNPFAKASMRTVTGAVLDPDAYVRHLAIRHSLDREATLAAVRASRE